MINKLIDKYKEIIKTSERIAKEQRENRFPDEITIRSEMARYFTYETVIKDLEELKKVKE